MLCSLVLMPGTSTSCIHYPEQKDHIVALGEPQLMQQML